MRLVSLMEFMPTPGDIVEFLTDRQTDKGPSSGTVFSADYKSGKCVIKHSDETREFVMADIIVEKYTSQRNHPDKKPYWGLA